MSFCKYCGKELSEETNFCPRCGNPAESISNQVIFVLQVKRVKDSDLGVEVFSSSVKDTLMEGNVDVESDARMADGPVVSNGLGQVYALGGKYVYLVGSYAIP